MSDIYHTWATSTAPPVPRLRTPQPSLAIPERGLGFGVTGSAAKKNDARRVHRQLRADQQLGLTAAGGASPAARSWAYTYLYDQLDFGYVLDLVNLVVVVVVVGHRSAVLSSRGLRYPESWRTLAYQHRPKAVHNTAPRF